MKITVVTVCYNAGDIIRATIESVLSQQRDLFEYIIIDGSSTDATMNIVNEYRDAIDIIVSEPDKGIYDAMNKGIMMAHGDYINFMNAGDYFVNNHVLADIAESIHEKSTDVVLGNVVYLIDGEYYEVEARPFYSDSSTKHGMGFCHQCCFVKTDMAKRFPFDLKYRLAADYNMIMNISRNHGTFNHVNMPVAYYDMNGVSEHLRLQHEAEVFAIDRPSSPITNYVEVRIRAAVRFVKKYMKFVIQKVAPNVIEKKRAADNKKKIFI